MGEVDLGGELRQLLDMALGVVVARLECLQGRDRLAAEAQGGGDFGPVELEGCGSLRRRRDKISSGSPLLASRRSSVTRPYRLYRIVDCPVSGGQLIWDLLTAAIFANDMWNPRSGEVEVHDTQREVQHDGLGKVEAGHVTYPAAETGISTTAASLRQTQ